jgi:hypothetical protein
MSKDGFLCSTVGNDATEMERLCLTLSDRWCEKRCVLPLAYLMCQMTQSRPPQKTSL